MLTKTTDQVLFQVMSDDMFLLSEIASQNGWTDVERFWQGEMINTPVDVNGWKLIPADRYEYSIPAEAVERVLLLVNSGCRRWNRIGLPADRLKPVVWRQLTF